MKELKVELAAISLLETKPSPKRVDRREANGPLKMKKKKDYKYLRRFNSTAKKKRLLGPASPERLR